MERDSTLEAQENMFGWCVSNATAHNEPVASLSWAAWQCGPSKGVSDARSMLSRVIYSATVSAATLALSVEVWRGVKTQVVRCNNGLSSTYS